MVGGPRQNPHHILWHCAAQRHPSSASKNMFSGPWCAEVWVVGGATPEPTRYFLTLCNSKTPILGQRQTVFLGWHLWDGAPCFRGIEIGVNSRILCHVCAAAVALFQYMLVPASSADRAVHDRISRISQGTASAMKRVKPWLRPSSSTPPWPTWTSMVCSVLCCHLSPSFQGWARCVASWFQGTTCVLFHPSLPSPLAPHWARKEGGLIMVTHAAPLPAPASPLPHWVPQPAFLRQQHRSSRGVKPWPMPSRSTPPWPT